MGWSEKWKKKDESKMKVVICIIAKLAHATLEVKDFKYINYIGCIVSKSHKNKKIDYRKYVAVCLCSSNTEILNISYQSLFL